MQDVTVVRDVVVVLPGIMGSELYRGETPVWSLKPRSLISAIGTLGRDVKALQLPEGIGDAEPEDPPGQEVTARGLLPGLHVIPGLWSPIDGYSTLLDFLHGDRFHLVDAGAADPGLLPNLVPYPYDWRLSCRANARRLKRDICPVLERWRSQPGFEEAELVIVAHSLGGLVARAFLELEGGHEVTRALVTIGTPHRGSVNTLETLVNGIRKGVGPLALDLGDLARSLPSLYELLPQYKAIVDGEGERLDGDGAVAGAARRVVDPVICGLDAAMWCDARGFHRAIDDAVHKRVNSGAGRGYELHKVVGIRQPTSVTALVEFPGHDAADSKEARRVRPSERIDGTRQGGDGTVPRLSAEPVDGRSVDVYPVSLRHGSLHAAKPTWDLIDGLLTRETIVWEGGEDPSAGLSVAMDEVWLTSEHPRLEVRDMPDLRLSVTVSDEYGRVAAPELKVPAEGVLTLPQLVAGGYLATVAGPKGGPSPIEIPFLVWDGGVR